MKRPSIRRHKRILKERGRRIFLVSVSNFPPVENADEHGLVAVGGDLEISTLLLAYQKGIFPWPISEEFPLAWFSPDPRGVIHFSDLKISKRLKRHLMQLGLEIYINTHFEEVIQNCATVKRKGQQSTWITRPIIESYLNLYKAGFAYSLEGYLRGALVAGLYGVCIQGLVSGESMFTKRPNAGKAILIALMFLLRRAKIDWLDTQTLTPVVKSLGGREISRQDFICKLEKGLALSLTRSQIFGPPGKKDIILDSCFFKASLQNL